MVKESASFQNPEDSLPLVLHPKVSPWDLLLVTFPRKPPSGAPLQHILYLSVPSQSIHKFSFPSICTRGLASRWPSPGASERLSSWPPCPHFLLSPLNFRFTGFFSSEAELRPPQGRGRAVPSTSNASPLLCSLSFYFPLKTQTKPLLRTFRCPRRKEWLSPPHRAIPLGLGFPLSTSHMASSQRWGV